MRIDEMPAQTIAFQCKNCGQCCGPVPFSRYDKALIINYLINNLGIDYLEKLKSQKREPLTCEYRDIEAKKCAIYPVRPEICRMQGTMKVYDARTNRNLQQRAGKRGIRDYRGWRYDPHPNHTRRTRCKRTSQSNQPGNHLHPGEN